MNAEDKPKLFRMLRVLGGTFRAELHESVYDAYFVALRPLSWEQVQAAGVLALERCEFMPTPARIRDFAVGSVDSRAAAAWVGLLDAMRRHGAYESVRLDDAPAHAAVAAMGGWVAICRHADLHTFGRRDFLRLYRDLQHRTSEPGAYLPGLLEDSGGAVDVVDVRLLPDPAICSDRRLQAGDSGEVTE